MAGESLEQRMADTELDASISTPHSGSASLITDQNIMDAY